MPSLLSKVNTYHGWASSTLDEIYSDNRLSHALRLEATTLDSILLLNDGEGRFEIRALPDMAQLAPVFGIALTDIDADGVCDAVLAQNFLTPQQETGPYDGGLSLVLNGSLEGGDASSFSLDEKWPLESGVAVPGDAMSLAVGDVDENGRPDLVFGVNQSSPALFLNQENASAGSPLAIELQGPTGNPTAIGARVAVAIAGLPLQVAEIRAGSGYLSQSLPRLHFGWGKGETEENRQAETAEVSIRWPDGRKSTHSLARTGGPIYKITTD
ncbi:MAG: CRTAC1 family protein [Verrucomicrobiae bacterium]|nr:CRTAC1 family protein [Verrucomicrobiae bacterium]